MTTHIDYRENPDLERGPLSLPTLEDMMDALWVYTKMQPDKKLAGECRSAIEEEYPDADIEGLMKEYADKWGKP